MEGLVPSSSRSGASVVDPAFLVFRHFSTLSRVVGSSEVEVRFRVAGVSDWGEYLAKYSYDDGETLLDRLSLPNPNNGPVAFKTPDPRPAGSAPELISELGQK